MKKIYAGLLGLIILMAFAIDDDLNREVQIKEVKVLSIRYHAAGCKIIVEVKEKDGGKRISFNSADDICKKIRPGEEKLLIRAITYYNDGKKTKYDERYSF